MRINIVLVMVLLTLPLEGQVRDLPFERFGLREGLPGSDIRAICQDRTGFLYFAGYQQLIRYDGHVFEEFTHDPEIPGSIGPGQISHMILASDGKIFLAMRRDGLNIFDPATETFTRYSVPVLSNALNATMLEDRQGRIWMGGDEASLVMFDRTPSAFTVYQPAGLGRRGYAVTGIVADPDHEDLIWITVLSYTQTPDEGERYMLYKFHPSRGQFEQVPCEGNVMQFDPGGYLWGGSWANGVWRYHPQRQECRQFRFEIDLGSANRPGDGVFAMHPMPSGYWMGSRHSILSCSQGEDLRFVLKDPSIGDVQAFFTDHMGHTWIGASNALLVYYSGSPSIDFFPLDELGISERIYPGRLAYAHDEAAIYLVVSQRSFLVRVPLDKHQKQEIIPVSFIPSAVAFDRAGQLWVSSDHQLYLLDRSTRRTLPVENSQWSSKGSGRLWSMSSGPDGLLVGIGSDVLIWKHDSLPGIRQLQFDGDGENVLHSRSQIIHDGREVIVSGGTKLSIVDFSNGRIRNLRSREQGHLVQDHEGDYWIGNINHIGRYRLDRDSLILVHQMTRRDGLTNITAHHLHVDLKGRIWVFSNGGMSVIDPRTMQCRNIGVTEGLPLSGMDPVQAIDLPDGRISTFSSNGIILFHPDSLWQSTTPMDVPVVWKSIRAGGLPVRSDHIHTLEILHLRPYENTLDVQFQGLVFPTDRYITYSYKVDGMHQDWIPCGQNNTVTFSHIPAGSYTLHVKAGAPETQARERILQFTVAAPFYRRPVFVTGCAMILLIGGVMTYHQRVRQIRLAEAEKGRVKAHIAELELQMLRAQMNPHFMFNSLNSIKNFILKNEGARAAEYLSRFAHLIRLILQHSREKSISLKDELEILLLYVGLEKMRFRDGFEFICQVNEGMDTANVHIPPMIIQPYIENAIWHGLLHKEDHRLLSLRFSSDNGTIHVEVEDNGIGRQQAAAMKSKSATSYKSMGMDITRDRISLMNSMDAMGIDVDIADKEDSAGQPLGTLVHIRIPYAHHTH